MNESLQVGGVLSVQHLRNGTLLSEFKQRNMVTDEGLDLLLSSTFGLTPPSPQWFLGLRGNGQQNPSDTLMNKAWTEVGAYSQGARQPWVLSLTARGVLSATQAAQFDITGDETVIRGVFISDVPALQDTSGKLFMVLSFGRALICYPQDTLKLSYTLKLTRA